MLRATLFLLCLCFVQSYRIDDWLTEYTAEEGNERKAGEGKIWVVLVAGSSGWYNYRHQSDICHIYQMLIRNHGIPRENIVTMMYNDIAYNSDNPFPGTIINALHGSDVYEGVMIDYMGDDVTPQTFLDVLSGKYTEKGSRKTVKSTKDDVIFVNFADHGGPGILAFPHSELYKGDLDRTLEMMSEGARFKQMLIYVEACYAGSMFTKLSADMNITAHTASNSDESSYACVLDEDLNTYLGDCWSLNWMNNTEQIMPNLDSETVMEQYDIVKKMTTTSHASIYGDLTTITNEPLSTFMGHGKGLKDARANEFQMENSIQSQDVMIDWLRRKLRKTTDEGSAEELKQQIKDHENKEKFVMKTIDAVGADLLGSPEAVNNLKKVSLAIRHPGCNEAVMKEFFAACNCRIQDNPYITKYLATLSKLCNMFSADIIVKTVGKYCYEQ